MFLLLYYENKYARNLLKSQSLIHGMLDKFHHIPFPASRPAVRASPIIEIILVGHSAITIVKGASTIFNGAFALFVHFFSPIILQRILLPILNGGFLFGMVLGMLGSGLLLVRLGAELLGGELGGGVG